MCKWLVQEVKHESNNMQRNAVPVGHFSTTGRKGQPSPCSRVLIEKLRVSQLIMTFAVFYGMRRLIAMFTKAHNWFLSQARKIRPTLIFQARVNITHNTMPRFFK
jgi:hypothetical protein